MGKTKLVIWWFDVTNKIKGNPRKITWNWKEYHIKRHLYKPKDATTSISFSTKYTVTVPSVNKTSFKVSGIPQKLSSIKVQTCKCGCCQIVKQVIKQSRYSSNEIRITHDEYLNIVGKIWIVWTVNLKQISSFLGVFWEQAEST